jgi:hypothetical protein
MGGWGKSGDDIKRLELAHGNVHEPSAPLVRVDTRPTTAEREGMNLATLEPRVRRELARSLLQYLWQETDIYLDATRSTFQSDEPTGQWEAMNLDVDGESTKFSWLHEGATWVALGKVGDALLGLQARNLEPAELGLVTVANPMEYLEDDGGHRY